MSRHHRPGVFALPTGFLAVTAFGAGFLFIAALHQISAPRAVRGNTPITVSPASARDVQALSSRPSTNTPPTRIDVDATRSCPANPELLRNISALLESPDAAPAAGQASNRSNRPDLDDKLKWARLNSDAAPISRSLTNPSDKLDIYAVHSRDGAAVVISNRDADVSTVQLVVRLNKAPYKVECLTSVPVQGQDRIPVSTERLSSSAANVSPAGWRVTRLKGQDLATTGPVVLPLTVRPGSVTVLRFTDTAFASRSALNELRECLRRLPRASNELSQRLHVILDGSGSCEKAIAANCSLSADRRRSDIHRFLLVLGQASSLQRNFEKRDSGPGIDLRAALDELNDTLADTSATLAGLVPGISLLMEPPPATRTAALRSNVSKQDEEPLHTATVIVMLSNQGSHSVDHVKIGLNLNELPAGVKCDPAEPALIGTLSPGQTARAAYELQWKGPVCLPETRVVGDVSYFTAGAPAHLRPHTW